MSIVDLYPPMRGIANLPWYTLLGGSGIAANASITAVTLTADATPHVKGAWAELVASSGGDATLLVIQVVGVSASGVKTSMLLDIATGTSGGETVRVGDIAIGGAGTSFSVLDAHGLLIYLPLRITTGQRVAARIQAAAASDTASVRCSLLDIGARHMVPTGLDVLGVSTATSDGTAMSGASGSWVEVVASTVRDYRAVVIVPCVTGTATGNVTVRYSLGVGVAGGESVAGEIDARYSTAEAASSLAAAPSLPIARYIPAGSRLAVQHDIASAPSNYGVCLIGVP